MVTISSQITIYTEIQKIYAENHKILNDAIINLNINNDVKNDVKNIIGQLNK